MPSQRADHAARCPYYLLTASINCKVSIGHCYNIVPDLDIDIYPTRSWDKDALTQPQPRSKFELLKEEGWLDSLRANHSRERIYTYWDYKRHRWEKNGALRLDHILLNEPLHRRLTGAGVDNAERGKEGASDHAPTWIELKAR